MRPEPGRAILDSEAPLCSIGCPREPGRVCQIWVKPAPDAGWTPHGPRETPTLEPSVNCVKGCGWHGYVVDGKLVDAPHGGVSTINVCAACEHPEIQTVHVGVKPLPDGRVGVEVKLSKTVVREPAAPRFSDDDFNFLGAVAGDLLRRIWKHNPDIMLGAFDPFVLGETADGDLAVWLGHPDDTTPALATFGDYDEGVEDAIAWIASHRNDPRATRSGHGGKSDG